MGGDQFVVTRDFNFLETDGIPGPDDEFWLFRNYIKADPFVFSFAEFAHGRVEETGIASLTWSGAISARPRLAKQLMPAVREYFVDKLAGTALQFRTSFRMFWRFLDTCSDEWKVEGLEDLTDAHGVMMIAADVNRVYMPVIRFVLNLARELSGMAPLYWSIPEPGRGRSSAPRQEHIKAIHHQLIEEVFDGIFARWDAADRLAAMGTDWSDLTGRGRSEAWTDADRHATYRGLIKKVGHPCPSPKTTGGVNTDSGIGVSWHSGAVKPLGPLIDGLYPTRADVRQIFQLFLLRTGWNNGTALNIDAGNYLRPHPTAPGYHIVHAFKKRPSLSEQYALGQDKAERSPGNLLRRLVERTEPLRAHLRTRLKALDEQSEDRDSDRFRLERADLVRKIESPWLHVTLLGPAEISALNESTCVQGGVAGDLSGLIEKINTKRPPEARVPSLTLSDFRDAFIGYSYAKSGHLWFVAVLAGQHRRTGTATAYLSHVENLREAWKLIRRLGNHTFDEIEQRKIADPAVLRMLVSQGHITEAQRARWQAHKDRTRVGMGCKDIRNPPRSIAPTHQQGEVCRVQRCTLCHHGILLEDSDDHLARRKEELIHLQRSIGLAAWAESTFPQEMHVLDLNLELFDVRKVDERRAFWRGEIGAGRHRVPTFGGAYAD